MSEQTAIPIDVFFSYAHEDEELRVEMEKHLTILKREGIIRSWHDRDIKAGDEWKKVIDEHLETARIILLLVSADFLASDYAYEVEMKRALERHENGEARVIPVILRPVEWQGAPFSKLQALPRDARPVTSWANRDEAFRSVAEGIRRVVTEPSPSDQESADKVRQLDEKGWAALIRAINEKKCTPFIGPDVRRGGISLRAKIAQSWAKKYHYPLDDPCDLARVSRFLSTVELDLDQVKGELIDILKQAPEMGFPEPDFSDPREPHAVLARLGLPVYICTDYQDFILQALKQRGKDVRRELCRWKSSLANRTSFLANGFNPNEANPLVFHLYGYSEKLDDGSETAESLALTDDDYLEFLINVSKDPAAIPPRIERAMSGASLLLLGYRLDDWDFRALFHLLLANYLDRNRNRTHVAVQLAPVAEETSEEQRKRVEEYMRRYVLDKSHIRVYVGACQDFITELNERI